jgi:TetR/AcrR family transcriptional regulator, regulator of cefoperazone and chloramphenicol sensitivity
MWGAAVPAVALAGGVLAEDILARPSSRTGLAAAAGTAAAIFSFDIHCTCHVSSVPLPCTEHPERKLNVRSTEGRARADLTAKAVIRDEALRLFAEHGPDRVSVRQVASAAGVSPGLVIHHYGSRQGLREAVDAHVRGIFDALFDGAEEVDWGGTASVSELFTTALPPDSPIPGYLRRLLTGPDPAGQDLFATWFTATRGMVDRLTASGALRRTDDPDLLAAFLLSNDLAVLLLRDQLTAVLGEDPLGSPGLARWTDTVLAAYQSGVFTTPSTTADDTDTPPAADSGGSTPEEGKRTP